MELIVINENSIKITLSPDEMSVYGLDDNDFHLSGIGTRKILDRILFDGLGSSGFSSSANDKLTIQLYSNRNGGCELFVTKIPIDEPRETCTASRKDDDNMGAPCLTYSFSDLENAISACKELKNRALECKSALYIGDDGKYYIRLSEINHEKNKSSPSLYLSEFGELENSEQVYLKMLERGRCLIPKLAIERLSEL